MLQIFMSYVLTSKSRNDDLTSHPLLWVPPSQWFTEGTRRAKRKADLSLLFKTPLYLVIV